MILPPHRSPTMEHTRQPRVFGLDLIRVVAVLLVLASHLLYEAIPHGPGHERAVLIGMFGVELFFVLSGFLIGQLVLRDLLPTLGTAQWRPALADFYRRRAWRILPAYYTVMLILTLAHGVNGDLASYRYWPADYVFLQNYLFPLRDKALLGVSWSLAIECWFYLLLPLYLYLARQVTRHPLWIMLTGWLGMLLLTSVLVIGFDAGAAAVRGFSVLRFEALLLGVVLAVVKYRYAAAYARLASRPAALVGILLLAALFYLGATAPEGFLGFFDRSAAARITFLPLMNLGWALLLPRLDALARPSSVVTRAVTHLSLLSYAFYLTHHEIIKLTYHLTGTHGPGSMGLAVGLSLAASFLLYRLVERHAGGNRRLPGLLAR